MATFTEGFGGQCVSPEGSDDKARFPEPNLDAGSDDEFLRAAYLHALGRRPDVVLAEKRALELGMRWSEQWSGY